MKGKKHNFATAYIKHEIESTLYATAATYLERSGLQGAIVTGPNAIRHVHNFRKYFGPGRISICEIKKATISSIIREVGWVPRVDIIHGKIEHNVKRFTDADLTCRSDINSIILALKEQALRYSGIKKAFIFSYGRRSSIKSTEETKLLPTVNSILEHIGAQAIGFRTEKIRCVNTQAWSHEVHFAIPVTGDIIRLRCFKYNAGGGPMVTCLICYK